MIFLLFLLLRRYNVTQCTVLHDIYTVRDECEHICLCCCTYWWDSQHNTVCYTLYDLPGYQLKRCYIHHKLINMLLFEMYYLEVPTYFFMWLSDLGNSTHIHTTVTTVQVVWGAPLPCVNGEICMTYQFCSNFLRWLKRMVKWLITHNDVIV